jgi:cytoplasmic iron level regulating protein YaaA (DUF328/UPF0246 family)
MLLLLPPSETKREGGIPETRLDHSALSFPSLTRARRQAITAVRALSRDREAAARALKLGPTQAHEVLRNRVIGTSPLLPSIDRYDGVLYEGLDAASLSPEEREFAGRTVAIASAAFGLTRALDPIPAYRLSHDSRLPGLALGALWRGPISAVLAAEPGLLLDLRSEAYAELGPAPVRSDSVFVRVVSDDGTGPRRALNHFNKKGKGEFVRALLVEGIDHPDTASLLAWATRCGIRLEPGAPGELDLVV